MKKYMIVLAALLTASPALADQFVNGYTRRDGTYVQPHYRSSPNGYSQDNYSYQGNTNPYTGKRGHDRNTDTYGNDCNYSSLC